MRVARVGDQRHAAGPKIGIIFRTRNLLAKLFGEFAVDFGEVDTGFFKHPAFQKSHPAAALLGPAFPLFQGETTRRHVAIKIAAIILEFLKRCDELFLQGTEPRACAIFAVGEISHAPSLGQGARGLNSAELSTPQLPRPFGKANGCCHRNIQ